MLMRRENNLAEKPWACYATRYSDAAALRANNDDDLPSASADMLPSSW